ncbi:MAG: S-methyl-5-thioribose-1-phosphate isomerase [Verrucomicrobiae bacterium]|nr:S-methyl-5-thioribose-1-phosphate isomerase [Verrucomicrobiae bacterium]
MKRTIWPHPADPRAIQILDQRRLPHEVVIADLLSCDDAVRAIRDMAVRGAPLIGATAAYGVWFACLEAQSSPDPAAYFKSALARLRESRPTAVNLFTVIDRQLKALDPVSDFSQKAALALETAAAVVEEDVEICRRIGGHGLELIKTIAGKKQGQSVNILTHCNAGRLACVEWGTATAPIYLAHQEGLPVHVWVDETRPRNQGANLTAWELGEAGIPHTVIVDNAGGHLMQHGKVDMVIVGTDRTTRTGDVANKIGTYLKALAAHDNGVPFYVALPSTTIDWKIRDGFKEIPIEERNPDEVRHAEGWSEGARRSVLLTPATSRACNHGFDVTPARLITGLITERGVCEASEAGLTGLFGDNAHES